MIYLCKIKGICQTDNLDSHVNLMTISLALYMLLGNAVMKIAKIV